MVVNETTEVQDRSGASGGIADLKITDTSKLSDTLTMSFTLTKVEDGVSVELHVNGTYSPGGATVTATVGGVFITRQ